MLDKEGHKRPRVPLPATAVAAAAADAVPSRGSAGPAPAIGSGSGGGVFDSPIQLDSKWEPGDWKVAIAAAATVGATAANRWQRWRRAISPPLPSRDSGDSAYCSGGGAAVSSAGGDDGAASARFKERLAEGVALNETLVTDVSPKMPAGYIEASVTSSAKFAAAAAAAAAPCHPLCAWSPPLALPSRPGLRAPCQTPADVPMGRGVGIGSLYSV
jgi:hypothetical protein